MRLLFLVCPAVVLSACGQPTLTVNEPAPDTAGCDPAFDGTTWYADSDHDGYGDDASALQSCESPGCDYVLQGGDCDDDDARFHPNATESACDDPSDYNCDGSVGWSDGDGDGTAACVDCDDADPARHPGATERCNGVDDDCDGLVDGPGAAGGTTWYADADGDGYGDASSTVLACSAPPGFVADSDDCDDTSSTAHPGGTEVCDDGADQDCDGFDIGCTGIFGESPDTGIVDTGGDTSGGDTSGGDTSGGDTSGGDTSGDTSTAPPDSTWAGASIVSSADWTMLGGTHNGYLGSALAGGDVDGDGSADLVVGAYGEVGATSASNTGAVRVWFGPMDPAWSPADAATTFLGDQANEQLGATATVLADGTVVAGANRYDGSYVDSGAAFVFQGFGSGTFTASDATGVVVSDATGDETGTALAGAGDVDGDGYQDLLVGAYGRDVGTAANAGVVALLPGPIVGAVALTGSDHTVYTGVAAGDAAGFSVDGGGDVDGDGLPDLLIGAPAADPGGEGSGAAYLVLGGGSTGTVSLASADGVYSGAAAGDDLGRSLAFLGDTDGDGYGDFAVSADDVDDGADPDHGAVYVWTGGPDGAWRGSVSTTSATATLLGANASDYAGRVVADGGDLDGDGLHDVLISATGFDNGATSGVGASYIAFGPVSGASTLASYDVRIRGSGGSDAAGYAIAGLGDTNGDALDDFVMSGIAVDDGSTSNVGSTWLFVGRSE